MKCLLLVIIRDRDSILNLQLINQLKNPIGLVKLFKRSFAHVKNFLYGTTLPYHIYIIFV